MYPGLRYMASPFRSTPGYFIAVLSGLWRIIAPAEHPETPMRLGSIFHSFALDRTKGITLSHSLQIEGMSIVSEKG